MPAGKRIDITDDMLEQMKKLAGIGLTRKQIAAYFGICERTLRRKRSTDERVRAALEEGLAKIAARVGQALVQQAVSGNINAIKWWEMTRTGRMPPRADVNSEGEPVSGGATIVLHLPDNGRDKPGGSDV